MSHSEVETLASGHEELQGRLERLEDDRARRRGATRIAVTLGGVAVFTLAATIISGLLLADRLDSAQWVAWLGVGAVGLLLFLLACDVVVRRQPRFAGGWVHRCLVRSRGAIVVLLIGIVASLVAAAIWDAVRSNESPAVPAGSTTSTGVTEWGPLSPFVEELITTRDPIGRRSTSVKDGPGNRSF